MTANKYDNIKPGSVRHECVTTADWRWEAGTSAIWSKCQANSLHMSRPASISAPCRSQQLTGLLISLILQSKSKTTKSITANKQVACENCWTHNYAVFTQVMFSLRIFAMRRCASALCAVALCPSIRLSVTSHRALPKRLNIGSRKQVYTIVYGV